MAPSPPPRRRLSDLLVDAAGPGRRPKGLILDVYGRYAAHFRGWLAVADLIELMALLGIDEQAVRSAVSRMSRQGLLVRESRGGVRGYAATATTRLLFEEADRRIYLPMEPARLDDDWVLVSFSMPEDERDKRNALRLQLMWLGLGTVSSGLRIGPSRVRARVEEAVARLGVEEYVDVFTAHHEGLGSLADLVRRSWDLSELADAYQRFLAASTPVLRSLERRRRPVEPDDAFAAYTLVLHEWRKFPYLDPGLPVELLPPDWPGRAAATLFAELRSRLEPLAFEHAAGVAMAAAS